MTTTHDAGAGPAPAGRERGMIALEAHVAPKAVVARVGGGRPAPAGGDPMDEARVERHGHAEFPYLLHGGTAPIRAQWYFREENRLPVAVQRWSFPPGATEGDHTHPSATEPGAHPGPLDELYLLVSGRATITLAQGTVDLGPGDAVLAPAGVLHGVRNDGPDTAEFVLVWGPPGAGLDRSASRMGALSAAAVLSAAAAGTPGPDAPERTAPPCE